MDSLSCTELFQKWRKQVGYCRPAGGGPRGIGGLGYLVNQVEHGDMVELHHVMVVVAHDVPQSSGQITTRVAGYRASRTEHGIQWGGAANARFCKDLRLCPRPGGGPMRLDLLNTSSVSLAIRLNRRIDMALRYQPGGARRYFRLPKLWAAYSNERAAELTGEGPEFEHLCERFGMEPETMFRKFCREHAGLDLFPLDWVSGQLRGAATVFVDLEGFPRVQTFAVTDPVTDLVGFAGASAFDFYQDGSGRPSSPSRAGVRMAA
jgi:hypothetical protein